MFATLCENEVIAIQIVELFLPGKFLLCYITGGEGHKLYFSANSNLDITSVLE